MTALTRGATGHPAPRKPFTPAVAPPPAKAKKSAAPKSKAAIPKAKANISKPRAKATATGRVEKKKAPATKNKREPSMTDKVKGAVEKAVGIVEGKPGKKAAGTKKMKGTDGKGATRVKKA
ncbi:hypothetical protein MMC28_011144 [Mycoblastus sanguinarius]|nr:hypothetical protein [Mycoblastus sanguinarius]